MINDKFKTNEYYKNRLSMFMSQNDIVLEQTKALVDLISTCDDIIETVYKVLDIYSSSYCADLSFYNPNSTTFQPLDLIASMVGVNRELRLDYEIETLQLASTNPNDTEKSYAVSLINIFDKGEHNTHTGSDDNCQYATELKKINSRALVGEGLVFTLSSTSTMFCAGKMQEISNDITLDDYSEGDIYYKTSDGFYKSFSKTKITAVDYYKLKPATYANGQAVYIKSGVFISNIDTEPQQGKSYWVKESDNTANAQQTLKMKNRKIIESTILTNKELINLIKAQIVKNHFQGTNGELAELYKSINLRIYTLNNGSYATASYLYDNATVENGEPVSKLFKKMFLYTDLFANSMGVTMSKVLVSTMGGFFTFGTEENDVNYTLDMLDYNLLR